jgi:hypothetical protein
VAPRIKNCRVCRHDFEAPDPRRTVCDGCTDPAVREREKLRARRLAVFRPLIPVADYAEELVEVGRVLEGLGAVSKGTLVGTLRVLNNTEGRTGMRSGLFRVAAVAVALARRLR